jgi:hypothetical protein
MTSVKNNSDISTCQCDTKPRDVGYRKMNERKEPGLTQCISTVTCTDNDKCPRWETWKRKVTFGWFQSSELPQRTSHEALRVRIRQN